MDNYHECCCSKEMMQRFRKALSQCVSEIDAIIGDDGGASGGRFPARCQPQGTRSSSSPVEPDNEIEEIPASGRYASIRCHSYIDGLDLLKARKHLIGYHQPL